MPDPAFPVGTAVTIATGATAGVVIAVRHAGEVWDYLVRYADNEGRLCDIWCATGELT